MHLRSSSVMTRSTCDREGHPVGDHAVDEVAARGGRCSSSRFVAYRCAYRHTALRSSRTLPGQSWSSQRASVLEIGIGAPESAAAKCVVRSDTSPSFRSGGARRGRWPAFAQIDRRSRDPAGPRGRGRVASRRGCGRRPGPSSCRRRARPRTARQRVAASLEVPDPDRRISWKSGRRSCCANSKTRGAWSPAAPTNAPLFANEELRLVEIRRDGRQSSVVEEAPRTRPALDGASSSQHLACPSLPRSTMMTGTSDAARRSQSPVDEDAFPCSFRALGRTTSPPRQRRLRRRAPLHAKGSLAEPDQLAAAAECVDDGEAVHGRAVRRAQIGDPQPVARPLEAEMTPRYCAVLEAKLTDRARSDEQWRWGRRIDAEERCPVEGGQCVRQVRRHRERDARPRDRRRLAFHA